MHPEHLELLDELRAAARPIRGGAAPQNDSYGGSGRPYYNASVPARRDMVRRWLKTHKTWTPAQVLEVVDSLFDGESHEEKTLGALILGYHAPARRAVRLPDLDRWLGKVNGWAEVDSLCQNVFPAEDMIADWPGWKALLQRLARDANINKRRAALVLLTGPVRYSDDPRFHDLAVETIDRLKPETPILITKAVSWLLRSMAARRAEDVAQYLDRNETTLPKIALRETRTKLRTGTKSGR
jgi:3-methyladenine DNA glycosylase AlkD